MNARTHKLDMAVESHQLEEALNAIFHALLLHRSTGKFHYKSGGKYTVDTIGLEDVDSERIDFTYVQISSKELQDKVRNEVRAFCESMRFREMNSYGQVVTGEIELQFYQKKRSTWPFNAECIPWEVWRVTVKLVSLSTEHERQQFSQNLVETMASYIQHIVCEMNSPEQFTPKLPVSQFDLENVYDVSLSDIQPYLFKFTYQTSESHQPSVGSAVKKILKDTLSLG